jgi:hypothetical protein
MKHALNRFLFDSNVPVMIDGTGLQPDPDLATRNLERAKQVIARMGAKWCCWNPRAAENDMQTYAAHSHTEE